MQSILTSIKKQLGIMEDYNAFDDVLIEHINSAFMVLTQLGVGPSEGFVIRDASAVWSDFLSNTIKLEAVKTYIGHKVRLMFDPPQSSAVMEAINRTISELEFRLNVAADN